MPRVSAPDAAHAARHWVIGPRADLDGFLCQVAAICEATGPGGGPPDILWLREIAKVYGLVPAEAPTPAPTQAPAQVPAQVPAQDFAAP